MTNEDQIAALFAKANPVPSLDLLDPVEPLDVGHLTKPSERSSEMTELKTYEPKEVRRPRRWLVPPALATIVIAVVAIPSLMNSQMFIGDDSTPSEVVANSFMAAIAEHDADAALELFAPDGRYAFNAASIFIPESFDHDRAVGWDYANQGCEEISTGPGGTLVHCPFLLENDWIRALGLEPVSGESMFLVEEGRILSVSENFEEHDVAKNAWDTFHAWVDENHPDDIATMYDPGGSVQMNPDANALWEQYTDEFVASFEG